MNELVGLNVEHKVNKENNMKKTKYSKYIERKEDRFSFQYYPPSRIPSTFPYTTVLPHRTGYTNQRPTESWHLSRRKPVGGTRARPDSHRRGITVCGSSGRYQENCSQNAGQEMTMMCFLCCEQLLFIMLAFFIYLFCQLTTYVVYLSARKCSHLARSCCGVLPVPNAVAQIVHRFFSSPLPHPHTAH